MLALGHGVELAGAAPLADEHVVLGLLAVPDSSAARAAAGATA